MLSDDVDLLVPELNVVFLHITINLGSLVRKLLVKTLDQFS